MQLDNPGFLKQPQDRSLTTSIHSRLRGLGPHRSTGENNHGYSWGKTAVEMALLRQAALSKAPERVRVGSETRMLLACSAYDISEQ